MLARIVAGGLAFAAVVVSLAWVGHRVVAPRPPSPPPQSAYPRLAPAGGFVEFRQPQVGIRLDYPAAWTRLPSADPQVALLLAGRPAGSFQLRTVELQRAVGTAELPEVRKATDEIVRSSRSVTMLAQPTQITVGGLPGFFYFYTFADPVTGKLGVHSHYFLFKGHTMITMVFQVIPIDQFRGLSTVFDQIAESLRVL